VGQIGQLTTAATAAGRLILEALESERPARSLSRLSDSPRAIRLLRELFIVAVRRTFVGREPRAVTRYVNDLLAYQSLPTGGEVAREAEALIRSAIGEPELAHGIPDVRRFELICHVVGDLARPPGGDLVALIDQAEKRVARFDRPRNRTIGRRSV
jgi:flavin-dependent dehydrogenase